MEKLTAMERMHGRACARMFLEADRKGQLLSEVMDRIKAHGYTPKEIRYGFELYLVVKKP